MILLLGLAVLAQPGASIAGTRALCVEVPALDDRCEAWVAQTGFGEGCCDFVENYAATNIAATGNDVFTTLTTNDPGLPRFEERWDFETVAFRQSDGSTKWTRRYGGPSGGWDVPLSLVLSPDDSVVYVSGYRGYPSNPNSIVIGGCAAEFEPASALSIAYSASSGAELWRYGDGGTPSELNASFSSTLSPDGSLLYVTGLVRGSGADECDFDLAVAAVDTSTGKELWMTSVSGPAGSYDGGYAVDVTPDGSRLLVGGMLAQTASGWDFTVLALDAVDDKDDNFDRAGAILWQRNELNPGPDRVTSMEVSPNGDSVVIIGEYAQPGTSLFPNTAYGTLSYDVSDGNRQWRSIYATAMDGPARPLGLAWDPEGDRVYVTGRVIGATEVTWEYGTLAYEASSGALVWEQSYRDPVTAFEEGADIVISPDGSRVYVTGHAGHPTGQGDAATIAYSTEDGTQQWVGRLNGSDVGRDYTEGEQLALRPDGKRLFVVGSTTPFGESQEAAVMGRPSDGIRGLVWSYDTGT